MNASLAFRRCLPWFNLPLGVLLALLQRTPAVRVIAAAADTVMLSRAGQLLRAAFTAAALGAMHSRAGATTYIQNPPNPVRGTVGSNVSVGFAFTGAPSDAQHWIVISGELPPGLSFVPAAVGGTINTRDPAITGVPTQAGNFSITVQAIGLAGQSPFVEIEFQIDGGVSNVAPSIVTQPQSQSVAAGGNVTFSVEAAGTPAPTYQWTKDGNPIAGATSAQLSLTNVQAANAGAYAVVVTNAAGSVTSATATLTVTGGGGGGTAPTIAAHPIGVTVAPNGTAALTVVAEGSGPFTYQWFKDGANLPGATDATLLLSNVAAPAAGAYTARVTNAAGSVTSNPATLAVAGGSGRVSNLSVRTNLGAGATLIVGFATSGAKSVLVRAVGPTLGGFGVPGVYADPRMELYTSAGAMIDQNNDWDASLAPAFSAVGAFPLDANSKDAALQASIAGGHSVHIKGPDSGVVLVELYDSSGNSPERLVNVSARNQVGTGDNILIAGFAVGGNVGKTLLIRAIGPTLAGFGVPGTLADPKLEIYNSANAKIVENDNWPATLGAVASSVGAFPLNPGSGDATLLVSLPPGLYSAQVKGADGGTGEALVEVYEVP